MAGYRTIEGFDVEFSGKSLMYVNVTALARTLSLNLEKWSRDGSVCTLIQEYNKLREGSPWLPEPIFTTQEDHASQTRVIHFILAPFVTTILLVEDSPALTEATPAISDAFCETLEDICVENAHLIANQMPHAEMPITLKTSPEEAIERLKLCRAQRHAAKVALLSAVVNLRCEEKNRSSPRFVIQDHKRRRLPGMYMSSIDKASYALGVAHLLVRVSEFRHRLLLAMYWMSSTLQEHAPASSRFAKTLRDETEKPDTVKPWTEKILSSRQVYLSKLQTLKRPACSSTN